jgi:hypothetical protein
MRWKLGLNRLNDPGTIQWCIDVINSILSYSLAYDVELSRQGYCSQNIFYYCVHVLSSYRLLYAVYQRITLITQLF